MIKKFDTFVNETFGMDLPKGSDPIIEKDSDNAMAKSQLTRTKDFVDMLIPIIDEMDDMEPWVQAKITKAEDYLNAVLNYYKGKSSITEAKRSTVHKAAKKGSYPVSIVVIRDGKVIAQELVKTPAEVPAAFNVIQSYHKHKGATVHIESKTGERLFSESLDEAVLEGFDIEKLHFETDPKKAEKLKIELGKSHGEIGKRKQIESAEYSLRKFRKSINFGDGTYLGEFIPGSYDAATSTLGDGPHKKAVKKIKWNQKKYDQWLEDVASNDGWKNAFDMAQNAKNEPGLIDWVKKQFRGDDPLQRIQWDIEGFAESVSEAKKFYKTKDIVKMAKIAGDIVLDAKDDIQYLSVAYGDRVPAKELEKVLNNYDLDLEDVMESVVNEAEKYITNAFKVGDKIKTKFGEWEVIETDYKPGKRFMSPFVFKGKDMKQVPVNVKTTNKDAIGYKVTDGDKYPITGFLYQYKDITKLATVGVDESVINEGKVTKKSISKASDDLAKIIIELKDNLGKLQKSKTDEERAKYIEIAKDLTIKRKDASDSLNLAIAKLDKNAELDLSGKD